MFLQVDPLSVQLRATTRHSVKANPPSALPPVLAVVVSLVEVPRLQEARADLGASAATIITLHLAEAYSVELQSLLLVVDQPVAACSATAQILVALDPPTIR